MHANVDNDAKKSNNCAEKQILITFGGLIFYLNRQNPQKIVHKILIILTQITISDFWNQLYRLV